MRAKDMLLVLTLISNPLCLSAQGVERLAEKLASIDSYIGDATFEVLLPSAEDPVVYDISLQSSLPVTPDSLAPCDYLIRWSTQSPSGLLQGFSAYFDGNHYRYRNNRLQEYHMGSNPVAFMPNGVGSEANGVQCQAQFADMLPQFVSVKLREIATDSNYIYSFHPDTIASGRRAIVVDGVKRNKGYDVMNFEYVFDYDTSLPVIFDIETSPGSISEQLVTITYKPSTDAKPIDLTEEALIAEWPEVFEKYRESSFRAESLVGNPLPSFSCQVLGASDRISYNRGESLASPSVFVFLDPEVASTQATIDAVRNAINALPKKMDVYYAFKSNHAGEIENALGTISADEKALPSAGTLVRNCGITLFPTVLIVDSQGIVREVVPGYNNDLSSVVIQKSYNIK